MTRRLTHTILFCFFFSFLSFAQKESECDLIIEHDDISITNYDASPGDTICILGGIRPHLYFKNIVGSPSDPVVIINKNGVVQIESEISYGLRFAECQYVKISGTGDPDNYYGIRIDTVQNGSGLEIRGKSSDFEVERMEMQGTKYVGIVAKTDPDCSFTAVRDSFTMYNVHIHDNYIHHVGTEGMYVGNSFFLGHYLSACDTTVLPHIIDGVKIYNNKVEHVGWDGIQVGCAINDCDVYNNDISFDSQEEAIYQMSGIIVNTGSKCNVFSNKIIDGKGTGIINQGAGGQHFYNNLIVNAGRDYDFEEQVTKQQFGIFSKFKYMGTSDSSFYFYNNTIINPKSDGIRYHNENSTDNIFVNNLIINPGAYVFYDTNGSVYNSGEDAYIHNYLHISDMELSHNIFERDMKLQYFADTNDYNFHLTNRSPAFNSGMDVGYLNLSFDLDSMMRPYDRFYDIGVYELQSAQGLNTDARKNRLLITPTASTDVIYIHLGEYLNKSGTIHIVDSTGKQIDYKQLLRIDDKLRYNISNLERGVYYIRLQIEGNKYIGTFIKI